MMVNWELQPSAMATGFPGQAAGADTARLLCGS